MEHHPTRLCALLVGLPDVRVVGAELDEHDRLRVHVEAPVEGQRCPTCGCAARVKQRPVVELVDLCCFGRPSRLVWRKHRLCCPSPDCPMGSWTVEVEAIAAPRLGMTDRAARWATVQVGRNGRTVAEVARELGCAWHTVNTAVVAYGQALLAADTDRTAGVTALGMDEILFVRTGRFRRQEWATQLVDVRRGRLLDVVAGRDTIGPIHWLARQPAPWKAGIEAVTLDLSGPYRAVADRALPDAVQVADPFHVVRVANQALDECRRRVQNETLGHRGRRDDPLYRSRRLLVRADERLHETGRARLVGLLEAGDPKGQVRDAWHAKEIVRQIYAHTNLAVARAWVADIVRDFADPGLPAEVRRLGRTVKRWATQITNWHATGVSNGPTEAINNLAKRIKRVGFGFRSFRHFRIRALLYAGRPNWALLPNIRPRSFA